MLVVSLILGWQPFILLELLTTQLCQFELTWTCAFANCKFTERRVHVFCIACFLLWILSATDTKTSRPVALCIRIDRTLQGLQMTFGPVRAKKFNFEGGPVFFQVLAIKLCSEDRCWVDRWHFYEKFVSFGCFRLERVKSNFTGLKRSNALSECRYVVRRTLQLGFLKSFERHVMTVAIGAPARTNRQWMFVLGAVKDEGRVVFDLRIFSQSELLVYFDMQPGQLVVHFPV